MPTSPGAVHDRSPVPRPRDADARPSRAATPRAAARAYPVLVAAHLPEVVQAGLEVLLRPYCDRVELLGPDQHDRAHVELFDPAQPVARSACPPRVALTWDGSAEMGTRARALGAVRVLPLNLGVQDLLAVCEQVHHARPVPAPTRDDDLLSPREVDVVAGICRGMSNTDIAAELFLSVNSVKTYIRTAYRKMGVTSRSQALLWGLERGF